MVFHLLELSQLPYPCSITELLSPIELIFVTSKIFAYSWLEPARSFAFTMAAVAKVDGYMHSLTISLKSIASVSQSKLL